MTASVQRKHVTYVYFNVQAFNMTRYKYLSWSTFTNINVKSFIVLSLLLTVTDKVLTFLHFKHKDLFENSKVMSNHVWLGVNKIDLEINMLTYKCKSLTTNTQKFMLSSSPNFETNGNNANLTGYCWPCSHIKILWVKILNCIIIFCCQPK